MANENKKKFKDYVDDANFCVYRIYEDSEEEEYFDFCYEVKKKETSTLPMMKIRSK